MPDAQAALAAFPDAAIDADNAAFFAGLSRSRLVVNRCRSCQRRHFPVTPVCPHCWSEDVQPGEVSGRGAAVLVVTVRHPYPAGGLTGPGPHVLVTLDLEEQPGLRYTAPLSAAESEPPAIGEPVELVFEAVGSWTLPVVRRLR